LHHYCVSLSGFQMTYLLPGVFSLRLIAPVVADSKYVRVLCLAMLAALACSDARSQNTTSGGCSPIVAGNTTGGDVTVTLNCNFGARAEESFEVQLLQARLECNSEEEKRSLAEGEPIARVPDLFARLQELDEAFVYVDLFVWVGVGCGIREVADQPAPRWGVVLPDDLEGGDKGEFYLDGFPGPGDKYEYGYRIEFDSFDAKPVNVTCRQEPGLDFTSCSQASTLLFPRDEGAFFNAQYGRGNQFRLEGIAKIRITEWQGGQAVEIVPATPIGGLANHYNRFKRYLREQRQKG
jgi:hypothetical protein